MICALVHNLVDLYLDDRLIAFQSRWVAAHLASCPGCAARLAAWRKVRRGLRELSAPSAPDSLKAALRTALLTGDREAAGEESAADLGLVPSRTPALSFAFSAAAFALFVSGSVFGPGVYSQALPDAAAALSSVPAPSLTKGEIK